MLGAVLAETEVVDKASSEGDGSGFSLSGAAEGRISGVLIGGEEALEVGMLLEESFPLSSPSLTGLTNLPAVCLVTAAAMPPLCFAFFLSFLAGIQPV